MVHRLSTGFGWLSAEVNGVDGRWVATLTVHHPSLGGVGPGIGRTPDEALADLALAVCDLRSARKDPPRSHLPDRTSASMLATAIGSLRRRLRRHGRAIANPAAVAIVNHARRRRQRVQAEDEILADATHPNACEDTPVWHPTRRATPS